MKNKPLLSIVIAVRNQSERLPTLLDSILAQPFRMLEVVIVDDASTEGNIAEVLVAYKDKGLDLHLYVSPRRLYTKDARLKGVELAKGEIITFADADDEFTPDDTLERHVHSWLASGCDVLHFRTMRLYGPEKSRSYNAWADPFAKELKGQIVFEEYAKNLAGHVMWNKLYSRALWLQHLDAARAIPITVCSEDLFLSTFYLFHARHYVGSDLIGYDHNYEDKIAVKSACRAVAFFTMLHDFIPYLEMHDCPPEALKNVTRHLIRGCQTYTNRACLEAMQPDSLSRIGSRLVESSQARNGQIVPLSNFAKSDVFAGIPLDRLKKILLFANARNAWQLTRTARDFL